MPVALSTKSKNMDVIINAIRELQMGKDNACGTVTLAVSATTTIVKTPLANPTNTVFFTPTTAHAAAEIAAGGMYVSNVTYGQFTITHANNTQADRTFFWTLRGS
jgi:hypothetical protein